MELDSVFQIKKFTKEFYERKCKMSAELLETLDALNNERPNVIQLKRRHFDMNGGSATVTKDERLEWMRLNAEKDRIQKFKNIAVEQSKVYYSLLETFNKMLELRKEPPVPSMIHMQASTSAS